MAQTKPKAAQFYGVSNHGIAGQVLISDGNGGMSWGANTELFTISWNTPTGQGLTYTQPSPQSSEGTAGSAFPTTTFTVTKSDTILSGTATIAGLPTGITATQVITGGSVGNTLTVTLSGIFPGANSLNTNLIISGLTLSKIVSWAIPTGQSLTYTQPSPQSSTGNTGTTFPSTTFTATKAGEIISGTATITGLPSGIVSTQVITGSAAGNTLTVTLSGVFPGADSLNTNLTLSGLTLSLPELVSYLVVAGGGSGSTGYGASGGGGGGYRNSFSSETSGGNSTTETPITVSTGTTYTITVGGGGAAIPGSNTSHTGGNAGGNSSIVGTGITTITSLGGGAGLTFNSGQTTGGSGGGKYYNAGSFGLGTAGQGFDASAISPASIYTGGGGAGAGGTNSPSQNGGAGLYSSITGSSIARGGGAGGTGDGFSGKSGGTGGVGGGANGLPSYSPMVVGNNGTVNTGGGGSGQNSHPSFGGKPNGGAGGSGVVILRMLTSIYSGNQSGASVSTSGTDTILTYNASGSYNH